MYRPSRGLLRDYEPSDGTFSSTSVRGEEKVKEKYSGWCKGWAVLSCSLFTPVVIRAWRLAADGN